MRNKGMTLEEIANKIKAKPYKARVNYVGGVITRERARQILAAIDKKLDKIIAIKQLPRLSESDINYIMCYLYPNRKKSQQIINNNTTDRLKQRMMNAIYEMVKILDN